MITVKTNIKSVISSLNGKIESFLPGAEHYDGLLRTVATSMIGVVKTRIHEEGRAADNSNIGTYSTKEMYASKSQFVGSGFTPLGKIKTGKDVSAGTATTKVSFKNSKGKVKTKKVAIKKDFTERKSMFLPGGYKQFRQVQGRPADKVNLSLSGDMNTQLTVQPTAKGYGYGWPEGDIKGGRLQRAKHLEKKYGKKIWALTDEEIQQVIVISQNYAKRALSE